MYESDKKEQVCVTMSVDEWAHVAVAIGHSPLDLFIKSKLNETIFTCVERTARTLS